MFIYQHIYILTLSPPTSIGHASLIPSLLISRYPSHSSSLQSPPSCVICPLPTSTFLYLQSPSLSPVNWRKPYLCCQCGKSPLVLWTREAGGTGNGEQKKVRHGVMDDADRVLILGPFHYRQKLQFWMLSTSCAFSLRIREKHACSWLVQHFTSLCVDCDWDHVENSTWSC